MRLAKIDFVSIWKVCHHLISLAIYLPGNPKIMVNIMNILQKDPLQSESNDAQLRNEIWNALKDYQHDLSQRRIESFFKDDPERVNKFSVTAAGLTLDYSKNLMTDSGLDLLLKLCNTAHLKENIDALFNGEEINNTEHRPALHMALRSHGEGLSNTIIDEINATYEHMASFVEQLHNQQWLGYTLKAITDVVNIGIGGSDLGPVMACQALTPYAHSQINTHFVSNIDGTHIAEVMKKLDPATTLFIVASKSFKTIETRKNAEAARDWCLSSGMNEKDISKHFVAVSTNIPEVIKFGIAEENIFPMWDWVGGRYSLWSAIGLPIAISIGMDNFNVMLDGGRAMDEHFKTADHRQNMPVILGLLSIWYINFFNSESQVVVPYDHYLNKFPSFLQQLEMESNGKSVHRDGHPVEYNTMGVIFGEAGSNTQHSFHQLLHQGTHLFPVDFIIPAKSHNPIGDHHQHLFANCLSQSQALMTGKNLEEVKEELQKIGLSTDEIQELAPHKVIPGNKPSNTIIMDMLTPYTLGALIALYEHKVFVESVIWDIDAFDQWGVELGKILSQNIFAALADSGNSKTLDPSTAYLINYFKEKNSN